MFKIVQEQEEHLFTFEIGDVLQTEDTQNYLNFFSQTIASKEGFGCTFHYLGGKPKKTREAQKLENEWIKAHKPELQKYCFGIAMISNPGLSSLLQKIVLKGIGQKMLGAECNLFYDKPDALAWLNQKKATYQTSLLPSHS